MKNFKFKWLLLSIVLSIASINTAWAWNLEAGYLKYSFNGSESTFTVNDDNNYTQDLGELTGSFDIKGVYVVGSTGDKESYDGSQLIYNIYNLTDGDGDVAYRTTTYISKDYGKGGLPVSQKERAWEGTINIATNTSNSGIYYFKFYFQAWFNSTNNVFRPNGDGKRKQLKYTIYPPAVSNFAVTEANHLRGTGTSSSDPYILPYNGTLSLTISASASSDAHSSAQYHNTSVANDWSTVNTKSISNITSTTPTSVTVKMRYRNSDDDLDGDESTMTIWYRSEARTTASISSAGNGTASPNGSVTLYEASGTSVSASPSPNYVFDHWAISGGGISPTSSTTTPQSFTATTTGGTIEAHFADQWNIKGSGDAMGSWGTYNGMPATAVSNTYSTSIHLDAGETYDFKIVKRVDHDNSNDIFYGASSTTFERGGTTSKTGLTTEGGDTYNMHIVADIEEDYVFTYVYNAETSGMQVSVTFPTPEYSITYKDQGNAEFSGTQTDPPTTHTYGTATILEIPTKTGYDFAGWWTDATCTATQVGTNSAASLAADGYTANITLYAKWTVHTTTITLNDRSATDAVSPSSVTATYDSETLASITNPKKWGYTFGGWVLNSDGTGDPIIDTGGNLVASVDGYTEVEGKWINDERTLNLYAKWTPSLYWVSGSGSEVTGTAFTYLGDGVYRATVTMSKDGTFHLGDGTTAAGPASNQSFATPEGTFAIAPSSYYFTYTGTADQTIVCVYDYSTSQLSIGHVVFYLGAKGGSHAKVSDYEGWHSDIAIISGKFEYRMLVVAEDTWSSLCLPFGPTEVKVWSGSAYYDVLPYYRDGGTFYKGHYIIRTPGSNTIPLSSFGSEWKDPTSPAFKPSGSTPYIIQWHDNGYFAGKYISFFGNGASLAPYSGAPGAVADDDAHVNLYGNTAMAGLSVKNGYLLNDGVWTRGELGENAYVGPFECYIRASEAVAKKARRIQSGINVENTATGWEDVLNSLEKPQIKVYNISGNCVAQYQNCSFDEAARRLSEEYREGVYILHAGNESVKLFVNGK